MITHPYIDTYFNLIESGQLIVCKEQLQLKDYIEKILSRDDVYIDYESVNESIEIPERYFPYKFFDWQKFINVFIFGLRWKSDDALVFDRYFVYMGRGGGKTGSFSLSALYMLSKQHGIAHYDIDIVATSEKQAKRPFKDLKEVLEKNEDRLGYAFHWTDSLIRNESTQSEMTYNTSAPNTKDGKRSGCVLFDEIHQYETNELMNVFTSGAGKVKDYREFYFTTDGYVRGGPLDDLKEESKLLLNGELDIERSTLFPFICHLDEDEEVDDPILWVKANPSLQHDATLLRETKKQYYRMQRNAKLRMEFMTKRMNRPIEDPRFEVASYEDRLATNQPIPQQLKGIDTIGGVDFADVRDFCSVGVLAKYKGKRYWLQHTFIHYKALEVQDINREIVQLALDKGLAEMVYDKSISPEKVVNWFKKMSETYYIKKICMDDYRSSILGPKLEEAGFDVQVVRRGRITHGKLSLIIDDAFINHTLVFGNDPLMRWFVGNVYVDYMDNDNKEYKKIDKETRKTDGFFALLHALNCDAELEDYGDVDWENINIKPISYRG